MATRISPLASRLAAPITGLLVQLRRRIRAYIWTDGLAALAIALGAAFWLSLTLDWLFEPPRVLRALALAAVAVVLTWIVFRMLVARFRVPLNNRSMALLLERRFAHFRESLLTSVELAEQPEQAAAFNAAMLATTHREAVEHAAQVNLGAVFNPAPLARRVSLAVALALAIGALAVAAPEMMTVWTRRGLLLSDELWPRKTRLLVDGLDDDGRLKVARGADWRLAVRADAAIGRAIPEIVEVRYTTAEGGRGRDNMSREGVATPDEGAFQDYFYTFKSVLSPLTFYVLGGDNRLGPYYLDVVDSPTISHMTLHCEYPEYMHREPRDIPVAGLMQLPRGTGISILAEANKPLIAVEIQQPQEGSSPLPDHLNLVAEHGAAQSTFRFDVPQLNADKTLVFNLIDTDGIRSRDAVRLALAAIADEAPQVNVQLKGIGTAITPQAQLPADGEISDDYGVAKVWFDFHVDNQPAQRRPIEVSTTDREKLTVAAALEVKPLELVPKQKLHWAVQADDDCALAEGPNLGTGQRYVLDVVTPDQLRAMLEARELGFRRRFETILEELENTRDVLAALGTEAARPQVPADTAEPGDDEVTVRTEPRALAVQAERVLQNVQRSGHETLEVAAAFDEIREEMINNRVDTEELKARLKDGVADPLRKIVEGRYKVLEEKLSRLNQQVANATLVGALRVEALTEMDAILIEMRAVLDKMLELETFNEVLDMLRQIIDSQEKINSDTKQKQKQKLRDLVE